MPLPGSTLSDVIKWTRRIIKGSSTQSISDETILDYINRFYLYHMPERIQLFELKRQYTFDALPNTPFYNFPVNPIFINNNDPADNESYDGYQILRPPVYLDGVQIGFFQTNQQFFTAFPQFVQNDQIDGDGGLSYEFEAFKFPLMQGHSDLRGFFQPGVIIVAKDSGNTTHYIVDNGNLENPQLREVDSTFQRVLVDDAGDINYTTGEMSFQFTGPGIPTTEKITIQTFPYSAGRPVAMLFFNNVIRLFPVPDRPYRVDVDVQVTPAQFLTTNEALDYSYMADYISLGAARLILRDTKDTVQLKFYEPFFQEAEAEVLRRTNRQQQVKRKPTLFSNQVLGNPQTYQQL